MLGHFLNYVDGKYVQIIGLKAPGNYSAPFCSNKISALLCGGPKPPSSIITGFVDHWEPLFVDLIHHKYLKIIRRIMDTLKNNILVNIFLGNPKLKSFGPDLEKTGTDK